jgi:hypothetical protein
MHFFAWQWILPTPTLAQCYNRERGAAWLPLAFFSKKLDSTQLNFSDREVLAAYLGVQHFRYLLGMAGVFTFSLIISY